MYVCVQGFEAENQTQLVQLEEGPYSSPAHLALLNLNNSPCDQGLKAMIDSITRYAEALTFS